MSNNNNTKELYNKALNKALSLLSSREHSAHELRQKLYQFNTEIIEKILRNLQENSYQSDLRFTESLIRSHMAKGKGSVRVLNDLKSHHLDKKIIQQAMSEIDEYTWQNLCHQVWDKKFANQEDVDGFKNRQKQKQFLTMRGFTATDWQDFLR